MVGRRVELTAAARLLEAAARGQGATLLITGEAGIGKSRLESEVASRATAIGMGVLSGRSVPGGGTYRAVAEALAGLLRKRPLVESTRLRPFRATLGRLIPGWTEAGDAADHGLDRSPDPGLDPTVVLGEGVLTLLDALYGGRGCMLVLEDLQWADADTFGLVRYLADAAPSVPLLLTLTARDESLPPGVVGLRARPGVTELPLTRLDVGGVSALAAACRGGTPLPEPDLGRLVARSEGLPFLVEELLEIADPHSSVPSTLTALVADRLAALPARARQVLETAATVGTDPDWRLLRAVTRLPDLAVLDALSAATEVGLLAADGGPLRWRHALTCEAVLASLLPPVRAALAARAARELDERGEAEDHSIAAGLFVESGEPRRAAEILVALARRDIARGALRSAAELLSRAVSPGRAAGAVAIERVRVLTLLGRAGEADDVGTAALDSGAVVGEEHAELCFGLARAAASGGRWATAETYLERAGRPGDLRTLVLAADAAFGSGDVGRAGELAREAVRTAERAAGPETLCEALMVLARTVFGADVGAAESAYRRAAQVAAEHALTPWRVEALFGLGTLEYCAGDPAAPSLAAARELAVRAGMLVRAIQIDLLRSDAVMLIDGPRAARPLVESAVEWARRLRMPALQASGEMTAAWYAAMAGDLPAMSVLLDAATSRAHAPPEVAALAPAIRAMPHLFAHDVGTAAALVDEGVSVLLEHGSAAPLGFFGLWALLRTAVADRDGAARETLRGHHSINAVDNRAALGYAEAVAAGRVGRAAEAAGRFAEADAAIAHLPWWRRLLRLLALEAAVIDGWGDPVPTLRADLAAHEQAGEPDLARACRSLLRAAGVLPRGGRGHSVVPPDMRSHGVTSREADVLGLVAMGLTNGQIGQRLFLSSRTVETHVANLLRKTGCGGRRDLGTWAATRR